MFNAPFFLARFFAASFWLRPSSPLVAAFLETALVNLLAADPGVSGILSGGGGIVPFTDTNTASYPRLTYWRSNSDRPQSNDGPTGQCIATFQIDAWAPDLATCWQLLKAVRLATNGKSGTFSGVRVDSMRWADQNDQINVPVLAGTQKPVQRATATITISYADP